MELASEKSQFLYQQVRDYLTTQTRNGKMDNNGRIPSERELAENLKISRGTVRMALAELEKSGFIERIPSKGAFLCQAGKKRTIRLALVFPEVAISQDTLNYADWEVDTEIWRGMLSACPKFNAVLSFLHCSSNGDIKKINAFADDLLLQYDGVLFIGQQLSMLETVLNTNNFPFISFFDNTNNIKNNIDYDRKDACEKAATHLLKCGCKNVFLLGATDDTSAWALKKSIFRRNFAEAGFWIPDENIIEFSGSSEDQCLDALRKSLPADTCKLPDAFFCATQIIPPALLRLANERNWRVPEDFMIMGYANNMQLRPTVPLLTHIRIPYFDIGYKGCEVLINNIIKDEKNLEPTVINADLIIGKTTYLKTAEHALAFRHQPETNMYHEVIDSKLIIGQST
jgi:DNA-binding LacI/PurR family transcriptional regulator